MSLIRKKYSELEDKLDFNAIEALFKKYLLTVGAFNR